MQKNFVFIVSLIIIIAVVVLGLYSPELLNNISDTIHSTIIVHFGWVYMLAAFAFLVFCISLAFSRYGKIKLGKDHQKPEYGYFGWLSMLFAAGMGIGLMFWGVAEPLSHYMSPPEHIGSGTGEAASFAMRYSFFHWGLQPWAIYMVMSLPIAYFSFRRGMPPLISSCFYPMLGDRVNKTPGYIIDILAVLATIFGIATSLGLGAMQISSGLTFVYGLPETALTTLIIIIIITVIYILTTVIGLDKGIQIVSKFNILMAVLLMFFMLILGPTSYIFNVFTSTLGEYANRLLEMSLQVNPFQGYEWVKVLDAFLLGLVDSLVALCRHFFSPDIPWKNH